jgi:hypothetical protein
MAGWEEGVGVGRGGMGGGCGPVEMVTLCYGVLKNRQPFDPDRASRKTR